MSRLIVLGVSALLVMAACTSSTVKVGEDDGGIDGALDGNVVDGAAGEPCGDNR